MALQCNFPLCKFYEKTFMRTTTFYEDRKENEKTFHNEKNCCIIYYVALHSNFTSCKLPSCLHEYFNNVSIKKMKKHFKRKKLLNHILRGFSLQISSCKCPPWSSTAGAASLMTLGDLICDCCSCSSICCSLRTCKREKFLLAY